MAMGVHQAGHEDRFAKIHIITARWCGVSRTDIADAAIQLHQCGILKRWRSDGTDPARVIARHASKAPVREPCRSGSYKASSATPTARARASGSARLAT